MPLDVSTRLATLLLMHKGELSRGDIAALPWIEDENEVNLIMSALLDDADFELLQRRVRSASIPDWEDVIVVKSTSRKLLLSI